MRGEHPNMVTARTGICHKGHSMADAYVRPSTGQKRCRTCLNEDARRWGRQRRNGGRARFAKASLDRWLAERADPDPMARNGAA